jgi:hypothetical protein
MPRYRLKPGFQHYSGGALLAEGSIVEMSPEGAAALSDRFELVSGGAPPPPEPETVFRTMPAAPAAPPVTSPAGEPLGDLHWAKAAAQVSSLDSVAALDAAEAEEKGGKARKGVLDAIEERRAELEG